MHDLILITSPYCKYVAGAKALATETVPALPTVRFKESHGRTMWVRLIGGYSDRDHQNSSLKTSGKKICIPGFSCHLPTKDILDNYFTKIPTKLLFYVIFKLSQTVRCERSNNDDGRPPR
jgi:hypothetical protein